MAARRLLIVMLILLGLSTLAAALVPQHALRGTSSTGTTTTSASQTATTTAPPPGRSLAARITVGAKTVPVVAGPICRKKQPECQPPIHVGDQLSLQILSAKQTELEIRSFGLVGVASTNTPAIFHLLFQQPGTIGVQFASTQRVAARIEVLSVKAAKREGRRANAKRRARAGSGPAS